MSREFIDIVALQDPAKIKKIYDTLLIEKDLVKVNRKAEKAIKNNAVVPEDFIELKGSGIGGAAAGVMYSQKWFLMAKALLIADDPAYNQIIKTKVGFDEVEEEYDIAGKIDKIKTQIYDKKIKPSEEEIKLTARAMSLADKLMQNDNKTHLSNPGMFKKVVEMAEKKDPNFLKIASDPFTMKIFLSDRSFFYGGLESRYTEEQIQKEAEALRTKSQIEELKAENNDLANTKERAEQELNEKRRISDMQKERDGRSIFWFIFRPISNLVNYIKLNNAKEEYKNNYILPKLEKFKNNDNYAQKVEEAVQKFNEDIITDKIEVDVKLPKIYTEEELQQTNFDDIEEANENDSLFNGKVQDRAKLSVPEADNSELDNSVLSEKQEVNNEISKDLNMGD